MPEVTLNPDADDAASGVVGRRPVLVSAVDALAAAGLSRPAVAAASTRSAAARSDPDFDPALARELQQVLDDALRDPDTHAPGAILHVHSRRLGSWTGVAGLGRVAPAERMRPADRFRAGSIAKMFVAVVVLQLAERGRVSLDAPLPDGAARERHRALPERGGHHGAHAARPPQRGSRNGTPP